MIAIFHISFSLQLLATMVTFFIESRFAIGKRILDTFFLFPTFKVTYLVVLLQFQISIPSEDVTAISRNISSSFEPWETSLIYNCIDFSLSRRSRPVMKSGVIVCACKSVFNMKCIEIEPAQKSICVNLYWRCCTIVFQINLSKAFYSMCL